MSARKLITLTAALVAAVTLGGSLRAQRDDASRVNDYFQSAIRQAASARNLAIDPQLSQDMIVDIGHFTGNFCMGMTSTCETILGDPDNLQTILQKYLGDAEASPAMLETMASRLAVAAGTDITKAGWPKMQANSLGLVEVPEDLVDAVFHLRAGDGLTAMGGSARRLLMFPGRWDVVAVNADGTRTERSVVVRSRQLVTLAAGGEYHAGRINVSATDYCPLDRTDAGNEVLVPFNMGRAVIDDIYSHAMVVTRQVGISISIDDQTGLCGPECTRGITTAFARALAIWRSGCGRCTDNALAVMSSGSNLWLDRRAAARLRSFTSYTPTWEEVDLERVDHGMTFSSGAVPAMTVPTRNYVSYDHVSSDAELMHKLCRMNSPTGSDWIASAKEFACGARPSVAAALSPRLTLTTSPTSCGSAAVACGKPEGEMEITLKDYAIEVPGRDSSIKIGSSENRLDVQAILLHEVGHWFGIPHPEAAGLRIRDIMSSVLNAHHMCVSAQSLALLTNATDTRFEHRAKGSHGLTVDADRFTVDGEYK